MDCGVDVVGVSVLAVCVEGILSVDGVCAIGDDGGIVDGVGGVDVDENCGSVVVST